METYITAELELVDMDEDVITASVINCTSFPVNSADGYSEGLGWTVYYSDGSSQDFSYYPADICG